MSHKCRNENCLYRGEAKFTQFTVEVLRQLWETGTQSISSPRARGHVSSSQDDCVESSSNNSAALQTLFGLGSSKTLPLFAHLRGNVNFMGVHIHPNTVHEEHKITPHVC